MKDLLKQFILEFDKFTPQEVDAVVDRTVVKSFKKGSIILREGEICRSCYFVLSGCIRQYQLIDGVEKTSDFFTEGQAAISYESYMQMKPSKHYLSCVEDSVLTAGSREQERELHKEFPKLEYMVHTLMLQEYPKIQERIASIINHPPEKRYQLLLETRPELINRVPLNLLASYIGVTPESFSRIRKRLLIKQQKHKS